MRGRRLTKLDGWAFPIRHRFSVTKVDDGISEGLIVDMGIVALWCDVVVDGGDVADQGHPPSGDSLSIFK